MEKKDIVKEIKIYLQKYFIPVFNKKLADDGYKILSISNLRFEEDFMKEIITRKSSSIWTFKAKGNIERTDFASKIKTIVEYEFVCNADVNIRINNTTNDLITDIISVDVTYLKELTTNKTER